MNIGLYSAVSGSRAEEKRFDVIANNLANINTIGFKRDIPLFKSVLSSAETKIQPQAGIVPASQESPAFLNSTSFVIFDRIKTDFGQGRLIMTGNQFDLGIQGEGFFVIRTPEGILYTRKGNFVLDSEQRLVTQEGFPVMSDKGSEIKIDGDNVEIKDDGEISVNGEEKGKIGIVDFEKPYNLKKTVNSLFESQNEGFDAKEKGFKLRQGYRELSNVNAIKEMVQMISIMRSYEAYQKVIRNTMESVAIKAVNEIGRLEG